MLLVINFLPKEDVKKDILNITKIIDPDKNMNKGVIKFSILPDSIRAIGTNQIKLHIISYSVITNIKFIRKLIYLHAYCTPNECTYPIT